MREQCNIQHANTGCRCIRSNGHDGLCWSAAERHSSGTLVRCLWISKNDKFKSHHAYEYTRPSVVTAKRGGDAQ